MFFFIAVSSGKDARIFAEIFTALFMYFRYYFGGVGGGNAE